MTRLVLETGVLGMVVHPRKHSGVKTAISRHAAASEILISELCDYELRRELIRIGATRSLAHLDELGRELRYLPVTTSTWRSAARLWALQRRLFESDRWLSMIPADWAGWVSGGVSALRS